MICQGRYGTVRDGFTFPFVQWLQQWAGELQVSSLEQGCFHKAAVEEVWKEFREGRVHWSRPWALVVLGTEQQFRN